MVVIIRRVLATFLALTALIFGTTVPAAAAPVPPDELDVATIDDVVQEYLTRHGLVGAQVAIVHDARVVHTAGYGQAHDGPTTPQTPMAVGSVSKQITAFAILQLVEEHLIDLDDPVIQHLPEFQLADARISDITIRHLLSHTSGLPSPIIVTPAADLREGVARLHDWQLHADPGQRYRYSNMNYHVAARLLEVVTQIPFAQYLERKVFTPLHMNNTRTVNTAHADDAGLQHGHVTAYGLAFPLREMEQLLAGAGGVVTTAEDLAMWTAMIINDGVTIHGEQLLAPELLAEAHRPQPGTDGEGLGWHLGGDDVTPVRIGHNGSTSRYTAQLDIVPTSGYGVVVMLNSYTPAKEHAYALSSQIIAITEGAMPGDTIPYPTLLDLGLGLATIVVLLGTIRGVRRAGDWMKRRATWSNRRIGMRFAPQLIGPIIAVVVFVVIPTLQNNSATALDVVGFWPAVMVLLAAFAVSGLTLMTARGICWVALRVSGRTPKEPKP